MTSKQKRREKKRNSLKYSSVPYVNPIYNGDKIGWDGKEIKKTERHFMNVTYVNWEEAEYCVCCHRRTKKRIKPVPSRSKWFSTCGSPLCKKVDIYI